MTVFLKLTCHKFKLELYYINILGMVILDKNYAPLQTFVDQKERYCDK